jgi:hypothetical protein
MEKICIPVHKITVPITGTELTLSVRGDYHYGVEGVDLNDMVQALKREQDQHRGNQFILYTGDMIENNLNSSIGHGYDLAIRDPHQQKIEMRDALIELQKHLHGLSFGKVTDEKGILSAGVIGNHEYRSRNTSGQWITEEMYTPAKILDLRMNGLIELTIVNVKLKISKVYKIFVSHRPNNANATAVESILRNCKKKKADIPADIYAFGHFHRRVIYPDGTYNENGEFKKVLYVVNPSPITYMEYADWSGYSPLASGWHVNVYLPLEKEKYPYGKV